MRLMVNLSPKLEGALCASLSFSSKLEGALCASLSLS